jgi:hypothetical protein
MAAGDSEEGQKGASMRFALVSVVGVSGALAAAQPASAATIVVFTSPETLERRMVVVDQDGPDRLYLCVLPPGEAGCHQVPAKRRN